MIGGAPRHLSPVLAEDTPQFPEVAALLISRRVRSSFGFFSRL